MKDDCQNQMIDPHSSQGGHGSIAGIAFMQSEIQLLGIGMQDMLLSASQKECARRVER